MTGKSPRGIARFDSATAMAQALALALRGQEVDSQSPPLDRLMPLANLLPSRAREWVYSIGGMIEGIAKREARHIDIEGIARWITGLFPERRYPAAFVGSSNGALMHLAAAIGAPWLPQTFVCPVRQWRMDPDDPRRGFAAGKRRRCAARGASGALDPSHARSQPGLMVHAWPEMMLGFTRTPSHRPSRSLVGLDS